MEITFEFKLVIAGTEPTGTSTVLTELYQWGRALLTTTDRRGAQTAVLLHENLHFNFPVIPSNTPDRHVILLK